MSRWAAVRAFTIIEVQIYLFLLFLIGMTLSSVVIRISKETGCSAICDHMQLSSHLLYDRIRRDLLAGNVEFYVKNKRLIRKSGSSRAAIANKIESIKISKINNRLKLIQFKMEGVDNMFTWYLRSPQS